jgi:oligogalacturonide lyase
MNIQLAVIAAAAVLSLASIALGGVGTRFPSERKVVTDSVTGVPLTVLTDGTHSESKFYQTHPQWSADGQWVIFRSSDRDPAGAQLFAVREQTGEIVQLTEGKGNIVGAVHLSRKENKLILCRHLPLPEGVTPPTTRPDDALVTQVVQIDFGRILADSATGSMSPASTYERVCATLPVGMHEGGGYGLDSDEGHVYMAMRGGDVGTHLPPGVTPYPKPEGARMGAGPGGLRSIDLKTGEMKVILDTPFQIGHVQSNPFVPGEIVYCWETGGKAPQRMWACNADGSNNRPLFPEIASDWITHEVVVTPDEVMFNLIGHKEELRKRPTGIAVLNLRTGAMNVLGQVDESVGGSAEFHGPGGFWHCNGSRDGRFAVGDTFLGNVWLINRADGRRVLLTTDHKMKPDHCHPSFHQAGDRILIQSGKWTEGKKLQLVVVPVPEELLRR